MSEISMESDSKTIPLRPALEKENSILNNGPSKETDTTPFLSLTGDNTKGVKQFKAGLADKRIVGRRPSLKSDSLRLSFNNLEDKIPSFDKMESDRSENKNRIHVRRRGKSYGHGNNVNYWQYHHEKLLSQVSEWLKAEKAVIATKEYKNSEDDSLIGGESVRKKLSTSADSPELTALSLEKLQKILEENSYSCYSGMNLNSEPVFSQRLSSSLKVRRFNSSRKQGIVSSDTEYSDGDIIVPSCDLFLDNSKTMSYTGGAVESFRTNLPLGVRSRADKEKKTWIRFKTDILKMAHTLKLKGWRNIPLEFAEDIKVERLSGALTNAVYVISPAANVPLFVTNSRGSRQNYCPRVLLRIYGPQVDHLIDRENELSILRRLARKKIGPKMLGTFKNGRFEEFFNARTLTSEDLRKPDTSKQIAKRMRELHDGVELLEREREEGPFVWRNWDKWLDRCEDIMTILDNQAKNHKNFEKLVDNWRCRGFICGVEWPRFKLAVEKYRKWLNEYYGENRVKQNLVFAHNDVCIVQDFSNPSNKWQTQYGNILRLIPETTETSTPSPLLLPANSHKQLVVIDFEYASANTPALEFANHFTEWCYNYHDSVRPWQCDTSKYPGIEEQTRFIRSYVDHQTKFDSYKFATSENKLADSCSNLTSKFFLDNRVSTGSDFDPGGSSDFVEQQEICGQLQKELQVNEILKDVRLWRVANSAQWVAWGIVQAQIPELNLSDKSSITNDDDLKADLQETQEPLLNQLSVLRELPDAIKSGTEIVGSEDSFDYLSYAADRALFFWGDLVGLGIITKEELPNELLEGIKFVNY